MFLTIINSATGEGGSARRLRCMSLGMVVAWLPALLARGLVTQVSALYSPGFEANPFLQPRSHAAVSTLATPVVVISSIVLFLSPGLLLVLATSRVRSTTEWIVLGFGASILLNLILGTGARLVFGAPLDGLRLQIVWLLAVFLSWLLLAVRVQPGSGVAWPFNQRADSRRLLSTVGASAIGVNLLLPKR